MTLAGMILLPDIIRTPVLFYIFSGLLACFGFKLYNRAEGLKLIGGGLLGVAAIPFVSTAPVVFIFILALTFHPAEYRFDIYNYSGHKIVLKEAWAGKKKSSFETNTSWEAVRDCRRRRMKKAPAHL